MSRLCDRPFSLLPPSVLEECPSLSKGFPVLPEEVPAETEPVLLVVPTSTDKLSRAAFGSQH